MPSSAASSWAAAATCARRTSGCRERRRLCSASKTCRSRRSRRCSSRRLSPATAMSARPRRRWDSRAALYTGGWKSMASELLDRRRKEPGSETVRRIPLRDLLHTGRPRALAFETRILLLALAVGLPGTLLALLLVWLDPHSLKLRWTVTLLAVFLWGWLAANLRDRVVRRLQTLANLLSALREGDFSLRARQAQETDVLAEVIHEVNAIGQVLREQRLGAVEAAALLHRVVDEVDVAVFAFNEQGRLRLVNRAGERLLTEPADRLLRRPAVELGLADLLAGEVSRLQSRSFPGGPGRWEIRRSSFREGGLPHRLLVISDLSQTLREEERQAWQRLIRVLGHELNNSLAPIHSMASTLAGLLTREPPPEDWKDDMQRGLEVIGDRSGALIRFMAAYA